ncbi:cell division cycle-associated protein 2 [Neolamprologus brichardi]|uniref:cell division cycle-associated protein 2 n=1 Tax=Neolamprologus brichardi TaxID=32507 RepID=UPI001643843E|nr:cell division cycle-associated protein 2 [Neolamprologus brichardi]
MATAEISTVSCEGDQEGAASPPPVEDIPSVLNQTSAPLNFSELTPSQFGISVQSFTPAASSNRKDKSRLAQLKARRRSSVGVRGSPETNSLICFMAQQKRKTPPASQTPELVRSSPFLPRVASTLRQKMASFQSLMDVEENDACDPVPAQDSNTGGCIKTRDYLSDGNSHGGGKENNPPMTPTPSKRRRTSSPPESCSVEIREASTPTLSSTLMEQEDKVFELQSLSRPPPDDPAAVSPPQRSSPFRIPSLPLLLEMKPTAFEARCTVACSSIVFPSVEEIGSAVASDTEWAWDAQPLNLNSAFYEESLSQLLTESDTNPSTTSQMDDQSEPDSLPEKEKQPDAGVGGPTAARSSNRRRKPAPKQELGSEPQACSSSRKRKLPEESEPVKRSARSAAKLASGKMKTTSSTTRRWNKDVDRSLYGSREYASKNPALSPITERLSFITQSPTAQETRSISCTAPDQETQLNPEVTNETQVIHDLAVTNASEATVEDSVTSPSLSEKSAAGQDSRLLGVRVRGRRLKKRKVSIPDSHLTRGETQQQLYEEQTTTSLELSTRTPSVHEERQEDTVELCAQTSADTSCTESECHVSAHVPTSDCPNNTEPAQGKAKRGRRSSVSSSVTAEQENCVKKHQTSCEEEEEERQGDRAASSQENIQSSSDSQEEGETAHVDLAPWQADFNFEDVFKPVCTRGQRSVRRSLRNQSKAENSSSAGLTWLPRTSPESSKETRRRTRGRRLSAALPSQPSLTEEAGDAS